MKFHIKTFGCQMNVCDSDWLDQALQARGWEPSPEERADAVLINTCSVREKPEQKIYSLLGRIQPSAKRRSDLVVGVGGCVAQQVGKAFWERFPFVRLVFGPDGVASVPDSLERLLAEPQLRISLLDFTDHYPEREPVWGEVQQPAQRYVNIMQGCDNYCAYCIVPYTRGPQKSRHSGAVLEECARLVENGVKEITLLGQNVNSFGQDRHGDGTSFAELLERICRLPGLERVRFTTSHPKDLEPAVVEAFGRFDNLCPSLHLPLQSGSDRVLSLMGRRYTRDRYLQIVRDLRKARPEIVLGTDLIVGFPSETEADFEATLEIMREIGFDSSFSFKYSDRPGTRAASMRDKVPEEVKARRLTRLQQLQDELTRRSLTRLKGRAVDVLVEGQSARSNGSTPSWRGRDPGGRVVNFSWPANGDLTGETVRVRITDIKKHSVFGEVTDTPWSK
jgi:tRNA-2-methylthio-N6-dimethylallyladenosine synthase